MSTTDKDQPFLGFAYGPWEGEPHAPARRVWAVHDDRTDAAGVREVLVTGLRAQHGYGDVVRAHERGSFVVSMPTWRAVTAFASVFVGTPTTREGGTWPRRKPRVELGELNLWDREPMLDRLDRGGPGHAVQHGPDVQCARCAPAAGPGRHRLGPRNPNGQPYA